MTLLYAVKGNKQLKIDPAEKETYLKLGYDIAEPQGKELKVTEPSPAKTIAHSRYKELEDENEELKAKVKELEELVSSNEADKKSKGKAGGE